MAEHGETGKHRRAEFFIEEPVTDHMLDIVRHHGEHRGDEIGAEIFVMQRREGDFFIRASGMLFVTSAFGLAVMDVNDLLKLTQDSNGYW